MKCYRRNLDCKVHVLLDGYTQCLLTLLILFCWITQALVQNNGQVAEVTWILWFLKPPSSETTGRSGCVRHWPSTMNLYSKDPAGRGTCTWKSPMVFLDMGMKFPQEPNTSPVSSTSLGGTRPNSSSHAKLILCSFLMDA
mmetsp:Transcript_9570/g.33949  ORF Transcript_9570/g.33949 Transcript_9570/m.33949 type:complete len:140 (-) Transcript_9570:605-1024(-)